MNCFIYRCNDYRFTKGDHKTDVHCWWIRTYETFQRWFWKDRQRECQVKTSPLHVCTLDYDSDYDCEYWLSGENCWVLADSTKNTWASLMDHALSTCTCLFILTIQVKYERECV